MISCRQKSEDLRQRVKLVVYWVGRPRRGGEATREWQGIQTISVMILARQAIQHSGKITLGESTGILPFVTYSDKQSVGTDELCLALALGKIHNTTERTSTDPGH